MNTMRRTNLMLGALMSMSCMHGCAGIQTGEAIKCGKPAAPSSYNIYLYVSREYAPNENVAQALEFRTNMSLLKLNYDVKTLQEAEAANNDGVLLRVEVIGLDQDPLKKKIGVQYVLLNNSTQEVMHYKYEEVGPFVAYGSVMSKMGRSIAREVDELLKCIQGREKV